jgi:hypothetical protein
MPIASVSEIPDSQDFKQPIPSPSPRRLMYFDWTTQMQLEEEEDTKGFEALLNLSFPSPPLLQRPGTFRAASTPASPPLPIGIPSTPIVDT